MSWLLHSFDPDIQVAGVVSEVIGVTAKEYRVQHKRGGAVRERTIRKGPGVRLFATEEEARNAQTKIEEFCRAHRAETFNLLHKHAVRQKLKGERQYRRVLAQA